MSQGLRDSRPHSTCSSEPSEAVDLVPVLTARHSRPRGCRGLTGQAAVVRLAAALGAGSRVISLDLLLFAGHDFRFGSPSWVEMG